MTGIGPITRLAVSRVTKQRVPLAVWGHVRRPVAAGDAGRVGAGEFDPLFNCQRTGQWSTMPGDDEILFGCAVLGREAVGQGPGIRRVPHALFESREAEAFRPTPAMAGGARRDDKFCGADGAVPQGVGAGDVPDLHEPDPGTGGEPIAVSHLDALLAGRRDVEGMHAPDTECESGPGPACSIRRVSTR